MPRGVAMLALAAVAATGCRQLFGIDDTAVAGDAPAPGPDATDASPQPDAAPLGPWTLLPPVGLGGGVANDDDPSLTEDLLEIYFNSDRLGDLDIFVSRRTSTDAAWGLPTQVVELSSALAETTPEVSLDGLTIYFASNRLGDYDIYMAQRGNRFDPWSLPMRVADLSTDQLEYPGCASPDRARMLVSRMAAGSYDVYLATHDGTSYSLEVISGLDDLANDIAGCMSPDFRTIYLESNRIAGSVDLFVATRSLLDDYALAPITELNTATAADDDVWVSPDGRHLFFHSDRSGTHQIYEATR